MENLSRIEIGMHIVFEFIYEQPIISEEILNFLFVYSREFDPSCRYEIKRSLATCLQDIQAYGIIQ